MQDRVEHELEHLRNWSLKDLQALSEGLEAMIHSQESAKPLYRVQDFEGTFRGCWDEVGGVDEFLKQERASWEDSGRAISELQAQTRHSITELRGMGKEFWQGIDVEEYIRQERGSCNENTPPLYDLREFRGIGHGTWTDVGGVDEFIKQERASWDDLESKRKKPI